MDYSKMKCKSWRCGNCGHETETQTDNLEELGFEWLDKNTCKTSCQNCGSYTLNRATTYDEKGRPIAGYFLVVRTRNVIRKEANSYEPKPAPNRVKETR